MTAPWPTHGQEPWGDVLKAYIDESINLMRSRTFDVRAYGAVGDGAADDTDAIEAAIAAIPNEVGIGGAELVFPYGRYKISRPIVIARHGVRLTSSGGFSALIVPTAAVTTTAITFRRSGATIRGTQISNIRMYMSESPANAIDIFGAYDNTMLSNVFVDGLNGDADGISILPRDGVGNVISQTVLGLNCWVSGSAGWTGRAWNLEWLQEATFVGCKGVGAVGYGAGSIGWRAHACKSIAWYNPSASNVGIAWRITAAENNCQGFTLDNPLFEQVGQAIKVNGSATQFVSRLTVRNPRSQSPYGTIQLTKAYHCDIDAMTIPVIVDSDTQQSIIRTRDISSVTDNGINTTVIEAKNSANFGMTIAPGLSVQSAAGDELVRMTGATSSGYTSMYLLVNIGSTLTLQRVTVGIADSGGAGFRLLRVAN